MARKKDVGYVVVPGKWGLVYKSQGEAWDAFFREVKHAVDSYESGNKSDAVKFFEYWFDITVVPSGMSEVGDILEDGEKGGFYDYKTDD